MTLPLSLRLALRDLRGGVGALRLLAVCLFLGVAAIAGVGSLSASIVAALAADGQAILGGDVQVEVAQRRASTEERAAFAAEGEVTELVVMRSTIALPDNSESLLGELKAVEANFPLYGDYRLSGGVPLAEALAGRGAAVGPAAAERLGIAAGDAIRVGNAILTVRALVEEEPDKVAEGFILGPTVLVSHDTLAATTLERPGSLFAAQYRIRLSAGADPAAVAARIEQRFPNAGFDLDDRSNAAPGARRFIERTGQFLTLVGLTSLLVAGVGVGNGVRAYLSGKVPAIAALKSLGAGARTIFWTYFLQILVIAAISVALGAAAGALVPWVTGMIAGDTMPVPPRTGLYPLPLAVAVLYGLLTAIAFALWPLAQARAVPPARLFRAEAEGLKRPPLPVAAMIAAAALVIAALAILQAREPLFAAGFVGGALGVLAVLALLGGLVTGGARRVPRPGSPLGRLALANLGRPGGMTRQLTVALGLGLTLFALLAVIETNLARQIEESIPDDAPSYFVLDIPVGEAPRFRNVVEGAAPGAGVRLVPSLRGTVVALGDRRVADMKEIPEGGWILRGDRGLTYTGTLPAGNRVTAGSWWPADYDGPQLVSVEREVADALSLRPGDRITVSVLGVELEAAIANLREVNWDSLGFNFALVFSPGPIERAPHSVMATITAPPEADAPLARAVGGAFPSASMIRIADVVDSAEVLLRQLSGAIRAAASVAIAAGIAVLVGAIAAARRARAYDAVILKVLGATRAQVLGGFLIEYAFLALVIAGIALALAALGGWYVVTQVFELDWLPRWEPVLAVTGAGAALVLGLSLLGSWRALGTRPAAALRAL